MPLFRLFHQALNDALARAGARVPTRRDDEHALTRSLIDYGQRSNWVGVPDYLLRSLPGHAAAAGMIDDLLVDDAYLLQADLRRLLVAAGSVTSAQAQRRIQLLGLTLEAVSAGSGERAAMFSVTQALENTQLSYLDSPGAPYLAKLAH